MSSWWSRYSIPPRNCRRSVGCTGSVRLGNASFRNVQQISVLQYSTVVGSFQISFLIREYIDSLGVCEASSGRFDFQIDSFINVRSVIFVYGVHFMCLGLVFIPYAHDLLLHC